MSASILVQRNMCLLPRLVNQVVHFIASDLGTVQLAIRQRAEEQNRKVQNAEELFVQFIAEHNLPFHTGDHFTKLVKSMFPDC